jgi:hypothetical protein
MGEKQLKALNGHSAMLRGESQLTALRCTAAHLQPQAQSHRQIPSNLTSTGLTDCLTLIPVCLVYCHVVLLSFSEILLAAAVSGPIPVHIELR